MKLRYVSGPNPATCDDSSQTFLHRTAFHFAANGWRGSHIFWKMVLKFQGIPDNKLITLPNGFRLTTQNSDWNRTSVYKGQYDRSLISFLALIKPAALVIDVGANIGLTIWTALSNSSSDSSFLALEPQPACFEDLRLFSQIYTDRGFVLQTAAGDKSGYLEMYGTTGNANSGGASLMKHADVKGDAIRVKVETLDKILKEVSLQNRPISLLKIDTEGYEEYVLKGAQETFRRNLPDVIVIEISPAFGSVTYLNKLWQDFSLTHNFFELTELGLIRRRAHLIPVELESALRLERQINLVVLNRCMLHEFM
jgi:FkbM family methyltransferase